TLSYRCGAQLGNGGGTLTAPIQVFAPRSSRSATDSPSQSVGVSGARKACPALDFTPTTARRRSPISQNTAVSTPHLEQMIHCAVPWPKLYRLSNDGSWYRNAKRAAGSEI